MRWLKQSTAFTFRGGPFVDSTDGVTAETGLSIVQADIQISKDGGAFAQTSDSTPTTTHDADGWYQIPLTTTDTDTLGSLTVQIVISGALPVFEHFMVVPANVYDSIVDGADNLQVDATQIEGTDATDQINAACDTALADVHLDHLLAVDYDPASPPGISTALLNELIESDGGVSRFTINALEQAPSGSGSSAASIADAVLTELIADHSGTAGSLAEAIDDILADTNELQSDDVPGLIAALNDLSAAQVNTEVDAALTDYDALVPADLPSNFGSLSISAAGVVEADTVLYNGVSVAFTGQIQAVDADTPSAGITRLTIQDPSLDSDAADQLNASVLYLVDRSQQKVIEAYSIGDYDFSNLYVFVDEGAVTPTTGMDYLIAFSPKGSPTAGDVPEVSLVASDITSIRTQVDNALIAIHLDHLLAADYDPASAPGVATALLNELVESDGGVSRFTINALENAPSGSGASAAAIADAVLTELIADHSGTAGSLAEAISDILGDTETSIPALIAALNDLSAAEVNAEVDTALTDYDAPTLAELQSELAGLNDPTAIQIRDAITGGAYALDTDANGRIRLVVGTAAGEVQLSGGIVDANVEEWDGNTLTQGGSAPVSPYGI